MIDFWFQWWCYSSILRTEAFRETKIGFKMRSYVYTVILEGLELIDLQNEDSYTNSMRNLLGSMVLSQ